MRILLRMASDSLLTPVTSIKSFQNKVTGIVGKIVSILMLPAFTNKAIFKQSCDFLKYLVQSNYFVPIR